MEEGLAATDREEACIESLEKLAGILNGASDKLDDLADSFNTSGEEFDDINTENTDKEIAAQIAAPLVNAFGSINSILNGVAKDVMEINNCDSSLIAELKFYIKEYYKPIPFPNPFIGKEQSGRQKFAEKTQGIRVRSLDEVSDLASDFIKEKHDYTDFAHSLDEFREKKGMSPAQLYKAAWIDKRLYSKIMSTSNYKPAKNTAISFGLALKLKPDEFALFLQNAGFALSYSSIFDLVIRFCVEREIFDLHEVNTLLLQADQKTLAKEVA
jgi:hypothetical protein